MLKHKKNVSPKNVSPLRYPGGKTRACKVIEAVLLQHFNMPDFDTLVSPFFGGGSFEFYLQNKYQLHIQANDKFTPLYNFWQQVKTNSKELCAALREIKTINKEDFMNYRSTIMASEKVKETAIKYFIINRCSFSGATLSGGFSLEASVKRYTPSAIKRVEDLDLTAVDFHNVDFTEFLKDPANNKTLLFLDPPYYLDKKSKLYGHNGDMHETFDHQQLFTMLQEQKNWLMTYNNCEYIRELYKAYVIIEVGWSYGMNKSKASSEIIILSKYMN